MRNARGWAWIDQDEELFSLPGLIPPEQATALGTALTLAGGPVLKVGDLFALSPLGAPEAAPDLMPLELLQVGAVEVVVEMPLDGMGAKGGSKPSGGGGGGSGGGGGTGTLLTYYKTDTPVLDSAEYNLEIDFKGSLWTQLLQDAFITAANSIASFITGDVQDVQVVGAGKPRPVDDLRITAEIANIDGLYGILGQAGPTALRSGSYLPATGTMQFDQADAQWLLDANQWGYVILHEMLHCVGIGTIWDYKGLIDRVDATHAYYTGANGNAVLNATQGTTGERIAIETDGGSGTAYGHWDETTYGNELMTGWLDASVNVLSNWSIASLADLGYTVASEYMYA